MECTGNKSLDMLWLIIAFLISLAWVLEAFAVFATGYNWLAIFVFWWMLGLIIGLFSKK